MIFEEMFIMKRTIVETKIEINPEHKEAYFWIGETCLFGLTVEEIENVIQELGKCTITKAAIDKLKKAKKDLEQVI